MLFTTEVSEQLLPGLPVESETQASSHPNHTAPPVCTIAGLRELEKFTEVRKHLLRL